MTSTMIELYTRTTPSGFKISIALEELARAYEVRFADHARWSTI